MPKTHTKKIRSWCVIVVNDDGRTARIESARSYEEASTRAGWYRDHMPEEEVEAGWNYLPELD